MHFKISVTTLTQVLSVTDIGSSFVGFQGSMNHLLYTELIIIEKEALAFIRFSKVCDLNMYS